MRNTFLKWVPYVLSLENLLSSTTAALLTAKVVLRPFQINVVHVFAFPANLSLNSYPAALTAFFDLQPLATAAFSTARKLANAFSQFPVSIFRAWVFRVLGLKNVLHAHYFGASSSSSSSGCGQTSSREKERGQGGGGISGQQWRWPKEARKRICENYLCCPSKAWLNFPNASAGHTSHYTHTHTHIHIVFLYVLLLYRSNFEWVFIDTLIWYVWIVG